jgi:hypothetical protein
MLADFSAKVHSDFMAMSSENTYCQRMPINIHSPSATAAVPIAPSAIEK